MKYRNRFDDVYGEDAEEGESYNTTDSIKDVLNDIENEVGSILDVVKENNYTHPELIDMLTALKEELY